MVQERTALRTISGTVTMTCGTVAGQTLHCGNGKGDSAKEIQGPNCLRN